MICNAGAWAEDGPPPILSLSEALQQAYKNNPTLRAARSELKSVQERLPQALAGFKPKISGEASITANNNEGSNFGSADGSTSKDLSFSLNQPVFRGGRTFAETNAANATIRAQEEILRSTEQVILLNAATAYMDVLRDTALLDLSKNNRDFLEKELEATRDRFEFGELTLTDVSQAEARLAGAESAVTSAMGVLNSTKALFEQIVGVSAVGLIKPEIVLNIPDSIDEAILKAETQNPRVLSAVFAHESSEEDVDGIFGELLPEIGFFAQWNRSLDPQPGLIEEQTSETVGLSATFPLYQAGAVRSRVRQAKHVANQRYLEIIEAKREIREEAIRNWQNLQTAEAEIRSRQAQVKAASVAREGVSEEMIAGARTVLDLLDAEQESLDAQVALVTSQRNEFVARFALLSTLGELSPDVLDFGEMIIDPRENLKNIKWTFFDMNVDSLSEQEEGALTSP